MGDHNRFRIPPNRLPPKVEPSRTTEPRRTEPPAQTPETPSIDRYRDRAERPIAPSRLMEMVSSAGHGAPVSVRSGEPRPRFEQPVPRNASSAADSSESCEQQEPRLQTGDDDLAANPEITRELEAPSSARTVRRTDERDAWDGADATNATDTEVTRALDDALAPPDTDPDATQPFLQDPRTMKTAVPRRTQAGAEFPRDQVGGMPAPVRTADLRKYEVTELIRRRDYDGAMSRAREAVAAPAGPPESSSIEQQAAVSDKIHSAHQGATAAAAKGDRTAMQDFFSAAQRLIVALPAEEQGRAKALQMIRENSLLGSAGLSTSELEQRLAETKAGVESLELGALPPAEREALKWGLKLSRLALSAQDPALLSRTQVLARGLAGAPPEFHARAELIAGNAAVNAGRPDLALQHYRAIEARFPDSPIAAQLRGNPVLADLRDAAGRLPETVEPESFWAAAKRALVASGEVDDGLKLTVPLVAGAGSAALWGAGMALGVVTVGPVLGIVALGLTVGALGVRAYALASHADEIGAAYQTGIAGVSNKQVLLEGGALGLDLATAVPAAAVGKLGKSGLSYGIRMAGLGESKAASLVPRAFGLATEGVASSLMEQGTVGYIRDGELTLNSFSGKQVAQSAVSSVGFGALQGSGVADQLAGKLVKSLDPELQSAAKTAARTQLESLTVQGGNLVATPLLYSEEEVTLSGANAVESVVGQIEETFAVGALESSAEAWKERRSRKQSPAPKPSRRR